MFNFDAGSGRLWASDNATGHIVFDTDDGLIFVDPVNDFFSGTIAVPNRQATSSGADGNRVFVNVQEDYFVGAISNPGATVIRGMMRTAWNSSPPPADNLWRQASGTHVDFYDGVSQTLVPQSDTGGFNRIASLGGYTFMINALQHLIMRERIVARARDPGNPSGPPTLIVRQGCTVSYRLFAGAFYGANFTPRAGLDRRGAATILPALSLSATVQFGYAFTGRRLVAVITSASNGGVAGRVPTSVTIGGVTATIHDSIAGTGSNEASVCIASASVPTGTSGTVTLAFSGGAPNVANVQIYALANQTNDTPTITKAAVPASAAASVAMSVGGGQMGIVTCGHYGANADLTPTWSGATADVDGFDAPSLFNIARGIVAPGAGSVTAQCNWGTSGDLAILGAVWG